MLKGRFWGRGSLVVVPMPVSVPSGAALGLAASHFDCAKNHVVHSQQNHMTHSQPHSTHATIRYLGIDRNLILQNAQSFKFA